MFNWIERVNQQPRMNEISRIMVCLRISPEKRCQSFAVPNSRVRFMLRFLCNRNDREKYAVCSFEMLKCSHGQNVIAICSVCIKTGARKVYVDRAPSVVILPMQYFETVMLVQLQNLHRLYSTSTAVTPSKSNTIFFRSYIHITVVL